MRDRKTAVIILNRNLPEVTSALRDLIHKDSQGTADIFVVESGSDKNKLTNNYDFYADWPEAMKNGLRYPNGMNYGLFNIRRSFPGKYGSYLLMTNDTLLMKKNMIQQLRKDLNKIPKCGIISPCGNDWGEKKLIKNGPKAFWHIHNNCYLVSEELVDKISANDENYKNELFDSNNTRGFRSDTELIAKGYINDYMSVITPNSIIGEDETLLKERFSIIKTDEEDVNWKMYIDEGRTWMQEKYGFTSHWDMNNYAINNYIQFFKWNPGLSKCYNLLK